MFDVKDPSLEINPDDMGYFPSRRGGRRPAGGTKKSHDSERCEACKENKGCGLKKKVKKQRKRRNNRGGRRAQQQQQQQQQQ